MADGNVRRPWQTVTSLWLNTRLDPYIKNMQVWDCPSLSATSASATSQEVSYISSLSWCLSVSRVTLMGVKESALLLTPAEIPFFSDVVTYETNGYVGCRLISMANCPLASNHNDQTNVGFLDGHVKSLQVTTWWKLANDSYNGVSGKVWR